MNTETKKGTTQATKRQGRPSYSKLDKLKKDALKSYNELTLLNKEVHAMLSLSDAEKETTRGSEVLANLNKRMDIAREILSVQNLIDNKPTASLKARRKSLNDKLSNLPVIGLTLKEWRMMQKDLVDSDSGSLGRPGIPLEVKILRLEEKVSGLVEQINEITSKNGSVFVIENEYNPDDFTVAKKDKKEIKLNLVTKELNRATNSVFDLVFGDLSKTAYDDLVTSLVESKGRPRKELSLKITDAVEEESKVLRKVERIISEFETDEERLAFESRLSAELIKISARYNVVSSKEAEVVQKAKTSSEEISSIKNSVDAARARLEELEGELSKKVRTYKSASKKISAIKDDVAKKREEAISEINRLELSAKDYVKSIVSKQEGVVKQEAVVKQETVSFTEGLSDIDNAIESSSKTLDLASFNNAVTASSELSLEQLKAEFELAKKEMMEILLSGSVDTDKVNLLSEKMASLQARIAA